MIRSNNKKINFFKGFNGNISKITFFKVDSSPEFLAVDDKAFMYVLGVQEKKIVIKQVIEPPKNSNSSNKKFLKFFKVISDLIAFSCGWMLNVTIDGVLNVFGPIGEKSCCEKEREKSMKKH